MLEGEWRPLFLGDRIVVGGGGRGKVDGAYSSGGGNELNKLVVTSLKPLRSVRAGKSRFKGERQTGEVKVQDGAESSKTEEGGEWDG